MTCVYCLGNRVLRDEQVLSRGEDLYLCAPRGQMVEGYLAIAPYRCIGCLALLPKPHFDELSRLMARVEAFYSSAYGTSHVSFYEQGRAGGGASVDALAGFPLHAHLCSLPLSSDLHRALHCLLASDYEARSVSSPSEIAGVAAGEPYLYLATPQQQSVYVPRTSEGRRRLAVMRLKPILATLAGWPERGHWREYPGDRELAGVIDKWKRYSPIDAVETFGL